MTAPTTSAEREAVRWGAFARMMQRYADTLERIRAEAWAAVTVGTHYPRGYTVTALDDTGATIRWDDGRTERLTRPSAGSLS